MVLPPLTVPLLIQKQQNRSRTHAMASQLYFTAAAKTIISVAFGGSHNFCMWLLCGLHRVKTGNEEATYPLLICLSNACGKQSTMDHFSEKRQGLPQV